MILLAGKSYQFPTDRQRQIGETEEVIKNGQSRETKQKHNTLCVGHHHTQDEDLHNKKVDEKIPSISMNAQIL